MFKKLDKPAKIPLSQRFSNRSFRTKGAGASAKLKNSSSASMIPNIMTVTSLCVGLSSMRFAMLGRWDVAVAAIFIAGILDAMDGRVARFLGSTSNFGAELDSLSDFVSFGVAPAIILYIHSMHQWGGSGWGICLFFAVCAGLRLARFNTMRTQDTALSGNFFTGVPITAGGALSMLPLTMDFIAEEPWAAVPYVHAVMLVCVGLLMISRIPTFSFKKVHVPHQWMIPMLVAVAILGTCVVNAPWHTIVFLSFFYILLLPFGMIQAGKILKSQPPVLEKNPEVGPKKSKNTKETVS